MKKLKRFLSAILTLIILFPVCSCSADFSYADFSAFNSNVHIEVYKKQLTEEAMSEAKNLALSLDETFDYNGENSLPTLLKDAEIGQKISLTPEEFNLVKLTLELNSFSDRAFNPLITPLTELWGFKDRILTPKEIPTSEEINKVLTSGVINVNNLLLENNELSKKADISLDFGGLLKGYASSKILDLLISKGYQEGYVSLGGSSLSLIGMEKLNVVHPRKRGESILTVSLDKTSVQNVSTSGDYENYYEIDGQRYCHIINPLDGYPTKTYIRSATVICPDGAFADGITTALCLKDFNPDSPQDSPLVLLMKKIIEKFPSSCIYVVYEKGEDNILITNKKQNENFVLLDDEYKIINV